ncbi:helix-turn-helix domain-containing protein [Kribbella speibonae]|uniref:AraC family transcriptional regulator n=1 Tax=Kribbella speibonae TaxID=1572660 RepID=A0A4R0IFW5_9ACTN|nr:AraC family transcriptional regulator [Kribbella speibonae]TCC30930.1 AraC family transcriptional regulator [Kribbella speibonae]
MAGSRHDVTELTHRALLAGAPLTSPGPLWFLVLSGTAELGTAAGTTILGAGDAAWLDDRTGFAVTTTEPAELAVADLRVIVAAHPLPSPLVIRGFDTRHPGVAELVRACPLDGACRASVFADGYGNLVGAAMTDSRLADQGAESHTDPLVSRVLEAVIADPANKWSVESLASLVHLSRSALSARFQKALGRSPVRMLREVRMGAARELLSDRSLPVEAVASRCGYGSIAAFSRAFAAEHGLSPQSWRASTLHTPGLRSAANPIPLTTAHAAPRTSVAATP